MQRKQGPKAPNKPAPNKPAIKAVTKIVRKKPAPKPSSNASSSRRQSDQISYSQSDQSSQKEVSNPFTMRERQAQRNRKPGSNVLQDIRKLQNTTNAIIPYAPFTRLVKDICQESYQSNIRFTSLAMQALRTSAQEYMVGLFEDSYLCAIHCQRVTLFTKDMHLARRIRGATDPANR